MIIELEHFDHPFLIALEPWIAIRVHVHLGGLSIEKRIQMHNDLVGRILDYGIHRGFIAIDRRHRATD